MQALKRLLKVSLIVALAVPLFLIIGFVLAISFMDFNKYKPMIEQEISEKTGLDLKIEGDLKASVWPLQLTVESSQISAPDSQPDAPSLLTFDQLNLQVSYRELLLNRRLQLTEVEWTSPRIIVVRQADGQVNWQRQARLEQDGGYRQVALKAEQVDAVNAILMPLVALVKTYDLKLNRFAVIEGELIWRDDITGQALDIQSLQFEAKPVGLNQPMALKLNAKVVNTETEHAFTLDYQTTLTLSEDLGQLSLSGFSGQTEITWPVSAERASLSLSVGLDQLDWALAQTDWHLQGGKLSTEHLEMALNIRAQPAAKTQAVEANVTIEHANLRYWLTELGLGLPNFVNQQALSQLTGTLDIHWGEHTPQGGTRTWSLDAMKVKLDQSQIAGHFGYRLVEKQPVYQFDLKLDQLNLDDYAIRASQTQPADESSEPVISSETYLPIALPVTTLRDSQVEGRIEIGQFQAWQTQLQQVSIGTQANYGQLALVPFDAKLYGGEWLSRLDVDVNHDAPRFKLKGRMQSVDAQAFLQDLAGYNQLSGALASRFDLRTQGSNLEAIKYHLNGLFSADLVQGAYHALDINKLLSGQVSQPGDVTALSKVTLKGEAINGIYHIQQADLQSERFQAKAFGRVNIPRALIDSQLQFTYKKPPAHLEMLQGVQLPIKLSGEIVNPDWQVELNQLLSPNNVQRLLQFLR